MKTHAEILAEMEIHCEALKQLNAELLSLYQNNTPMRTIVDLVCQAFNVDPVALSSRGRTARLVSARHATAVLAEKAGLDSKTICQTLKIDCRTLDWIIENWETRKQQHPEHRHLVLNLNKLCEKHNQITCQ